MGLLNSPQAGTQKARDTMNLDRLWRLLPGVAVLRGYRRSWLRGDLLAGAAVTAYLIP